MDATERLIEGRDFEDVSIGEIVAEAGVSTSSFYARFDSKEALLRQLHVKHCERVADRLTDVVADGTWAKLTPGQGVRRLLTLYLAHRRKYSALLRTFALAELRGIRFRTLQWQTDQVAIRRIRVFLSELLPDGDVRGLEIEFVIRSACAAVQAAIDRPDRFADRMGFSDEEIVAELTRMLCGYLGVPTPEDAGDRDANAS